MGKNKSKKQTRKAENATQSNQNAPSNTPLQSLKSTGTVTVTPTPPYSSDGPTLPVIGGEGMNGYTGLQAVEANPEAAAGSRKKRKLGNGAPNGLTNEKPTRTHDLLENQRTDLAPLYEPWSLLPLPLRTSIAARFTPWEEQVIPVVFTKNQNIKSGINKLKMYLGAYENPNMTEKERGGMERVRRAEAVIAVSAQGEATTKLASIVDMTKRVVQSGEKGGGKEAEEGEVQVEEWYMYTSLSSRVVVKARKKATRKESADGDKGEEEGAFETLADIQEQDREKQRSTKTVAVLTVWISKTKISEFRDAFGEEIFTVNRKKADG